MSFNKLFALFACANVHSRATDFQPANIGDAAGQIRMDP
jgi:hypothetical protein